MRGGDEDLARRTLRIDVKPVRRLDIEKVATKRVARPERFELPTPWFEAKYSIQLS